MRSGRGVNHPPHQTSRLQEELSYIATPPLGLHGLFCGYLYLYLYYKHVMTSGQQYYKNNNHLNDSNNKKLAKACRQKEKYRQPSRETPS
jgi:hypothetical protein